MLYVSSRSKTESFTSHRTLCADRAPDGGAFLPYRIPNFDSGELKALCEGSFAQTVANVLNIFFSSKLTAWDIEICSGRAPVRLKDIPFRVVVSEGFHNPKGEYSYVESNLYRKLSGADACERPTQWARIAIRIAVLFATYGMLPEAMRRGFDVSINCDDFAMPMYVWYARKMGLPIRTIICSCNENSAAWDLIQKGEMNTGALRISTEQKGPDYLCPDLLESLIYHTLGIDEAVSFADTCKRKGTYRIDSDVFDAFSAGFYSVVVGTDRIANLIRSVYQSAGYCLTDRTAIVYGGLQDYRARTGESQRTLILADSDPSLNIAMIAAAVGVSEKDILKTFRS